MLLRQRKPATLNWTSLEMSSCISQNDTWMSCSITFYFHRLCMPRQCRAIKNEITTGAYCSWRIFQGGNHSLQHFRVFFWPFFQRLAAFVCAFLAPNSWGSCRQQSSLGITGSLVKDVRHKYINAALFAAFADWSSDTCVCKTGQMQRNVCQIPGKELNSAHTYFKQLGHREAPNVGRRRCSHLLLLVHAGSPPLLPLLVMPLLHHWCGSESMVPCWVSRCDTAIGIQELLQHQTLRSVPGLKAMGSRCCFLLLSQQSCRISKLQWSISPASSWEAACTSKWQRRAWEYWQTWRRLELKVQDQELQYSLFK